MSLSLMACLSLASTLWGPTRSSSFAGFLLGLGIGLAICAIYSLAEVVRVVSIRRRYPGSEISGFTTFPELIDEWNALQQALSSKTRAPRSLRYPLHYILVVRPSGAVICGGFTGKRVYWELPASDMDSITATKTRQGGFDLSCLRIDIATPAGQMTLDLCLTDTRTVFPIVAGKRYHASVAAAANALIQGLAGRRHEERA